MTEPDKPLLTRETFTGAAAAKRAHKQALAVALAGPEPDDTDGLLDQIAHKVADRLLADLDPAPDVEQPRDAAGRWASHSGFDGGARPLPPPRPESHDQTLSRLLRSAVARRSNIDF